MMMLLFLLIFIFYFYHCHYYDSTYYFYREKTLKFESSKSVPWDAQGWLTLDATRAAEEWTLFPSRNMGLYMKITDVYGNYRVINTLFHNYLMQIEFMCHLIYGT